MKKLTFYFLSIFLIGPFGLAAQPARPQEPANVSQLIRDSQTALAADKSDEAVRLSRSAVDLDPAHPPAWRQYGLALLKGGKAQEAATALQRAVSMDEKDATAWRGLAMACWQTQQQNEAVRALSAYLRVKPEDAGVWRDLATWLTQLERGEQAVAALERVTELKPEDASAWRELGAWLTKLERYEQAVAAFEHAVKLHPEEASAWRGLATALTRLERYEPAVAALEQVVKTSPDDVSAWRDMATALIRLKRNEQAVAALERVVKLKPEDVSAWRDLATELARLERHEQAVAALANVVKAAPDDASAWRDMATGQTRIEQIEQAIASLEQALKLQPEEASAWQALAVLHQRTGKLAEAAKDYEKALALRPGDPVIRRDLGWALWSLGRRDDAVARLTEAVEAGIESRDRVIFQVVARLAEEDAGEAALAFLRKVSPNSPTSTIGLALARGGRVRAAEPILLNAWQNGEQTAEVGLYLAYARALNGRFDGIDKHLDPLLSAPGTLPQEQADLVLETLRQGNTRPETPALMARLEARLGPAETASKRVTDILETCAEASRIRGQTELALQMYRRVLERDPARGSWSWAVLLAERVEGKTPFVWLDSYEKRVSDPARLAGIRGLRAARLGQPEAAVPELRKSIALDQEQPLLRQLLFDSLLRVGNADEARAEAEWFAKRVEAGDATARPNLAEMLTRLGETAAALPHWETLRKANPDSLYYGVENATALFRLGRADEAMDLLRTLAGTKPNSRVFELMSEIETARTNTAQSVEWARRGLEIAPAPGLLRYHAEGLEKLGTNHAAEALASAQRFLKDDPGYVPLTVLAGRMLASVGKTNELEVYCRQQLARNPIFTPSLTGLREITTLDGRIDEATEYARLHTLILTNNSEVLRSYANSLAQQDHFVKALKILRPLARTPVEKAVPILTYPSIMRHPYPGRNSVDQISRHIRRLSDEGYRFINAFSQIGEKPEARHVMIVLIDPDAEVIEALDPVLQRHGARVVYAGNAAVPTLTLAGTPLPARLAPVLSSGRWQLASGGPVDFERRPVTETGVLGNPLTHPLVKDCVRESQTAFSNRLEQVIGESARALKSRGERMLVYPSGDFGQRSLDTTVTNAWTLHHVVANHFTHALYFDDSGFYLTQPAGDPLRIPARVVPPEWDEQAVCSHLQGTGHPLVRARLELGRVLFWHGQHAQANAAFAEAERAGADREDILFNWGMNADRDGDIFTAKRSLLAAQILDPGSERISHALARLEKRRRPQATAFFYGWTDNEDENDRDHYRYGAYADTYVNERLSLGAAADRNRWNTDGIGDEYGTRLGLRSMAYLWPEIWFDGRLWALDMDDQDDHWGGQAALRLPNPLLSGHVYLYASREEIETVEALRANIDANTYALRTYSRLLDVYDLFANLSQIDRSDGNDTTMLDGKLLYRLQEWPYVGVGWRFRIADSDRDPPEYWAPEELQQHQLHINIRGAWSDRLSYTASAEAGYAEERDTDWRFVWGARGEVNYFLTERFSVNGEAGWFETPDYDRLFGRLSLTGRF